MKLDAGVIRNLEVNLNQHLKAEKERGISDILRFTPGWVDAIEKLIADWREMNEKQEDWNKVEVLTRKLFVPKFENEERELMIARIRDLEKIASKAMRAIDEVTSSDPLHSASSDIYHTLFDDKWHKLYKTIHPNNEKIDGEEEETAI